jgi:hypothetical protein
MRRVWMVLVVALGVLLVSAGSAGAQPTTTTGGGGSGLGSVDWETHAAGAAKGATELGDSAWGFIKDVIATPTGALVAGVLVLYVLLRGAKRRFT